MEEQAVGSEAASEAEVNAAAAAEIAASKAPEQAASSDVTKPVVADPASVQKTSPQKASDAGQSAFDAQKSYEEVSKQLSETRKWATQQAQQRAAFEKELTTIKKQHEEMARKFADATETPFDLAQFNKEFVAKGPKTFDPYIEKKLSAIREQYEPVLGELKSQNERLSTDLAVMQKKMDTRNYPNFAELEGKMVEILNSPNCPIDRSLPLDQKIDAVYNLAKSSNSEEAVKVAQKSGYDKAQAELAKEAKTAVATGGKGVSSTPADLHNMPLEKLEKYVQQMHGIADRD